MKDESKAAPTRLSRERIVGTALRVLDQHGLQNLSLRRVAEEFGVQTPALYWHIRNRQELLGLMADELLFEVLAAIDPHIEGEAFLVAFGRASARMQVSRRDAAQLLAMTPPTDRGRSCVESEVITRLARGGIAKPSEAVMAVFAFTLGWSLLITHAPMKEHLTSGMNLGETFEAGLLAIVVGFKGDVCSARPAVLCHGCQQPELASKASLAANLADSGTAGFGAKRAKADNRLLARRTGKDDGCRSKADAVHAATQF